MNVLIDTNVLLSAALRDRLPEQVVLYVATRDDFRWVVTPEIFEEYTHVLRRPRFALGQQPFERWTALLAMRTVNIGSPPRVADFARDPKDAPFLAAALATRADFLITGDHDLLQAKGVVTTRIVTTVRRQPASKRGVGIQGSGFREQPMARQPAWQACDYA